MAFRCIEAKTFAHWGSVDYFLPSFFMSHLSGKMRSLIGAVFSAGILVGIAGTGVAATLRGSLVFSDVPSGSFYDASIGQMYNLGIIKGYDNGTFGPNDPVTRGQLAVMLQRFRDSLGDTPVSTSSSSSKVNTESSSSSSSSSRSSSSSSSSQGPIPKQGTFRFTAGTYTGPEGSAIKLFVVRTGGAQGTVTVNYATADGTAVGGTDYTPGSGTLTFANNETSKNFTINLTNNPLPQGNKSFTVALSNVTNGGTLSSPSTTTVTIQDNQTSSASSGQSVSSSSSSNPNGVMNLSALAYMVNEKNGPITVTIMRDEGSTGTVTVAYGTSNGTATSGSDYTTVNGIMTFNSGETSKTISIPVSYNMNITGSKSFNVILGSPTGGATLGTTTTSPVTIVDNESTDSGSGTVKLAKATYSVSKSSGAIDVLVQRTGNPTGTVTVNYTTTPLTAGAGTDYIHTSGTLTFQPGEATKRIRVTIVKTANASGKTFAVDLSSVTGSATMGTIQTTTVTIDN